MWDVEHFIGSIWDYVKAVKLRSKIFRPPICFPSYLTHDHHHFPHNSFVSIHDLSIRHPNALELINIFPLAQGQCFRPEAELLLQKYFSLKTENHGQFIANVKTYFGDRILKN